MTTPDDTITETRLACPETECGWWTSYATTLASPFDLAADARSDYDQHWLDFHAAVPDPITTTQETKR